MILSGAPLATLPLGALPDVAFVVTQPEVGADVTLNGQLARDLGLRTERVSGWLTAPSRQWPGVQLPGRQGNAKTATEPREAAVELRISAVVEGFSVSDARSRIDTIKHVLARTPVRVITPDAVTRYVVADVAAVSPEQFGPQFIQRKVPVEITLVAHDPYHYDTTLTEVRGPAATRLPCALGTAPVRPRITVTGAATNPVLTLRDYLGNAIATMTFGATALAAAESLVADCDAMTVTKNGVSSLAALTAGAFFKLDASAQALRDESRWPTIETSSGTLLVQYVRAHL